MKSVFRTTGVLVSFGMLLCGVSVGHAQDKEALVAATLYFAFYSDFEVNLHDALLEAGRTRWSDKPELFHSGGESECFTKLSRAARSGWDQAVGFYAETVSPPQARTAQFVLRLGLIDEELDDADEREVAAITASVRAAAAPAYRGCRWEAQDEANRGWVARLLPLLEEHDEKIAKGLADLYEKPLDGLPIRTDMVETVGWSSANTIYLSPEGGHIWVRNSAGEGAVALETVFHESSHTLTSPGSPIPKALADAAEAEGVPLPRGLWHGVLFYTTGDLVRRVLEEAGAVSEQGEQGYLPMMFDQNIFGEYHEVLEAEWTGYLRGKKTMDEAARDLVRAVAETED